jgi:predicted ArsR family transcriptional regulator
MHNRHLNDLTQGDAAYLYWIGHVRGDVTAESLADLVGVTVETAESNLADLEAKGAVESRESTYYISKEFRPTY